MASRKPKAEKKEEAPAPKQVERILTQEDFDINPQLADDGLKVGDKVLVEDENDEAAAEEALHGNDLKPAPKGATEVDVISKGKYVRTFSREAHGKDFMEVARAFAGKHGAELVDADGITVAVVEYRAIDKKTGVSFPTARAFHASSGPGFKAEALRFRNEVNGDSVIVK